MSSIEFEKDGLQSTYDLDCENEVQKMKVMLDILQHVHQEFVEAYRGLSISMKSGAKSLPHMADIGFFFRELEATADELRKDSKAHKELNSKILALRLTQEQINDLSAPESVKGLYASARPTLTKRPKMPKRDTKEFKEMCEFFGMDADIMQDGICKFDWKKTSNFLTDLAEEGKNIPFPIETYNDFSAVYTRKSSR
jgi:hypothetical protein